MTSYVIKLNRRGLMSFPGFSFSSGIGSVNLLVTSGLNVIPANLVQVTKIIQISIRFQGTRVGNDGKQKLINLYSTKRHLKTFNYQDDKKNPWIT